MRLFSRDHTNGSGTIEFEEFLSFFVEPVDMCALFVSVLVQVDCKLFIATLFAELMCFAYCQPRATPRKLILHSHSLVTGGAAT